MKALRVSILAASIATNAALAGTIHVSGVGVDDSGRPYADMNRDCKVDLGDFAVFQNQLFGP